MVCTETAGIAERTCWICPALVQFPAIDRLTGHSPSAEPVGAPCSESSARDDQETRQPDIHSSSEAPRMEASVESGQRAPWKDEVITWVGATPMFAFRGHG